MLVRRSAIIKHETAGPVLLANVVLLVVGCFLEPVASISILVPVLMPVILKVGIDPVHFGVVMTLNLMIGLLHPPLGMVLFVLGWSGWLNKPRERALGRFNLLVYPFASSKNQQGADDRTENGHSSGGFRCAQQ